MFDLIVEVQEIIGLTPILPVSVRKREYFIMWKSCAPSDAFDHQVGCSSPPPEIAIFEIRASVFVPNGMKRNVSKFMFASFPFSKEYNEVINKRYTVLLEAVVPSGKIDQVIMRKRCVLHGKKWSFCRGPHLQMLNVVRRNTFCVHLYTVEILRKIYNTSRKTSNVLWGSSIAGFNGNNKKINGRIL